MGYRDPTDVMFRNETVTTEARVTRRERNSIALQTWRPGLAKDGCSSDTLRFIPRSLGEDYEKQALNFFLAEYVLLPRHVESIRGYMEFLIPIYMAAPKHSTVFPAISATALGSLAHKKRSNGPFWRSQILYVQACARLKEAVADPVSSRTDATLMAIFVLSIYDTMSTTRATSFAWGTHADGAAALVKHRGDEIFSNPISRRPYWSVSSQTLINRTIKCEPIEPFLDWTDLWSQPATIDLTESAANRLTMMGCRLPALGHAAIEWLRTPMSANVLLKVLSLKRHALALDEYIAAWSDTLPESWRVREVGSSETTEEQESVLEDWEFWPGPIHAYYDLWVANAWNFWRSYRLFCNYIIINCCERLHTHSELEKVPEYRAAKTKVQGLSDDICASVLFQLGQTAPILDAVESIIFTNTEDVQSETNARRSKPDLDSYRRTADNFGGWFLT